MSSIADIEGILGEATGLEGKYEWLEASGLYERALQLVDEEDHFRRGEIQEKIGLCLHRAAFQAESQEEFKKRMQRAVDAYEDAHGFYEKLADDQGTPWIFRCRALTKYLRFWLASDPSEKRKLLDECLELERKALNAFWDLGGKLEYGRTFNELSQASWFRAYYEWDREARKRILEEGVAWGERAVEALSELGNPYVTARAHYSLALNLMWFSWFFIEEPEKRFQNELKRADDFHKAVEFFERVGDTHLAGLSYLWLGFATGGEESKHHFEKALECGEETKDNYLKASTLDVLAYRIYWEAHGTEDPDQRRIMAEEAMEFYDLAENYYSIMSFQIRRSGGKIAAPTPGGYAEYYLDSAEWETDLEKKRALLEKSEKAGLEALKVAEESDLPLPICRMSHILSRTLTAQARMEPDTETKRSLLEEALRHRERNLEIWEQWLPIHTQPKGVYHNFHANIKAELASIQPDQDSRRSLLEDAVAIMEISLQNFNKIMPWREKRGHWFFFANLTGYQDDAASILIRLYKETNNPEHLRRAMEIWREEIESAEKGEMVSRIAESYWQIAKTQDILGKHSEAAESFQQASESYVKSAEKIPQLKEFYQDYASYMRAWSEFEKAKQSHMEKRYLMAKEHYEKAAELHKSTERWSHLAPNYLAWARLEEAEDLSRREETEEARDFFQQANGLFKEAKSSIEIKLGTVLDEEEKNLLVSLTQASDIRRDYCLGRIALEEGRILDRQGDHLASSRRYGQAAERFQNVIDAMERELDQRELRPIIYLSRAWQRMMMAEEQMSSSLYQEAAELFMEAREHALDQTTRLLAQAHSSFCKALGAGTEFEITRKTDLFSEAKRHIEAATSHYLRAGHKTRSDYARATGRLLDAYLYTYNAQTESDPKRRTQFYQMAERLLQSSAGAYLKAKHPEKSDEIRRVLESVKEEREIAVSLSEVLHASTIVSTTASFSTPTPTHEQAVGLERFENADIQANLILGGREVKVGDDIDIEIELVNAGKAPAQLIKVEEIIPKGFEVTSAPDICRVEDSYLDMKGRTLNPLKTAELKIVLKPINKGTFDLRPRILYLDEAGRYRSHEPEPATVVVKELGIKGWLRGPTR